MPTFSYVELAQLIAQKSAVSVLGEQVLIICDRREEYAVLLRQEENIKKALNFIINQQLFNLEWVTIGVKDSDIRHSICMKNSEVEPMRIILPTASHRDLIEECLSYDGACGIVRMSDHKGLFSNEQITFSSKAHPNDWIGKNMADYWIEDELTTYLERLSREKELRDYSYVAKMMDGQNARLIVNARLIEWHGESARIVKTVTREFLA